jgi:hypothetical protein
MVRLMKLNSARRQQNYKKALTGDRADFFVRVAWSDGLACNDNLF